MKKPRPTLPRRLVRFYSAWRGSRDLRCVVIHRSSLTESLPAWATVRILCRHVKNRLRRPDNLAIVLVHNYKSKPIMARSLDYAGIHDYVTLDGAWPGPWFNRNKLTAINKLINSEHFNEEYLLFSDSVDAVIRADPAKAIPLLERYSCKALFGATASTLHYYLMPEMQKLADEASGEHAGLYLNSGVYVAKTAFLRELLACAMEYITEEEISLAEYRRRQKEKGSAAAAPGFPLGVASDQLILRYIQTQFGSDIGIDYEGLLAHRTAKAHPAS